MQSLNSLKSAVFHITEKDFQKQALEVFHFQFEYNKIYQQYVRSIGVKSTEVVAIEKIPFMPIQFFKHHVIQSGKFEAEQIFESSGTTGSTSKHYIEDVTYYEKITTHIFNSFFGTLYNKVIIGLLPSYLQRGNSSLIYMVNHFIEQSTNQHSGFHLENLDDLVKNLNVLIDRGTPPFLFGVTYALLELARYVEFEKNEMVILETGGMKGRGKDLTREELHERLHKAFKTDHIYSEYGMTELLSQAYLQKDGLFHLPPWMRIMIREIHDPFKYVENGNTGAINVIDLANVHSCAFIETEDLGVRFKDGFSVLGRLDNSDLRGCNLLLS